MQGYRCAQLRRGMQHMHAPVAGVQHMHAPATVDALQVFSFPDDVMAAISDDVRGANPPPRSMTAAATPPNLPFRLPFNVVAGSHQDSGVHPYWFVRLYRWATCEAYRSHCSELRLLRQLLLEDGFWTVKEEADARYRRQQGLSLEGSGSRTQAPVTPPAAAAHAQTTPSARQRNTFDPDRDMTGTPPVRRAHRASMACSGVCACASTLTVLSAHSAAAPQGRAPACLQKRTASRRPKAGSALGITALSFSTERTQKAL
jgi:hypothetical protein